MEIDNELLLKSFVAETGEGLVQMASQDVLRELTTKAASGKDAATPRSKKLLQRIGAQVPAKPGRKSKAQAPESDSAALELPGFSDEERPASAQSSARTLRVDVQKLDRLLDLTGEIAIARGRTTRLLENRAQFSIEELAEAHNIEATLQSELQELVMKVRMVPVGPLFRQYLRTVRDLSRELGKTVNLQIEGDDVEVDTSVVEHLRDPLLHMIRNALDHGIELPDQRRKAGKSPAGTITDS